MSSPMSNTGHDGQSGHHKKPVEFQFCAECSNMLYPKEDEETRTLQFTCRTCHYTTAATNTCVFRKELNSSASLHAGIIEGMGKDPTVGAPDASSHPAPHHAPAGSTLVMCLVCGKPVLCAVCNVTPFYICRADLHAMRGDEGVSVTAEEDDDDDGTSFFSPQDSDCSSPRGGPVNFSWPDDSDIYDFLDDGAVSDDGSADLNTLSKSILMTDDGPSTSNTNILL